MLPLNDFIAGLADFRRRGRWFGGIALACLVIWLTTMIVAGLWFRHRRDDFLWVLFIMIGPWLPAICAGAWLMRRDTRLVCPHCRGSLHQFGPWVVATRNCCGCGRRMLDEPEAAPSGVGNLLTEEGIRNPARVELRRELIWIIVALGTALGLFALAAVFVLSLRSRWEDGTAEWLPFVILAPTILILEYLIWLRWGSRNMDRSLCCPHCAQALVEVCGVVLDTGCCGHCGGRVLSRPAGPDEDSPHPVTPLTSVGEFLRLQKRWALTLVILVFGMVFGFVSAMGLGAWISTFLPGGEQRPPEGAALAVLIAVVAGWLVAFIALLTLFHRRRDPRLNCPHCGKDLTGKHVAILIATRRCPQCKRTFLAEPAEQGIA
ncbi:MAG: alkaline shock response membrane anchor protein AmaP [Gemmataceae bacterium]|nr:alkaline shock response membrane anchor protein AmaP [Gemmataceae bacterium]